MAKRGLSELFLNVIVPRDGAERSLSSVIQAMLDSASRGHAPSTESILSVWDLAKKLGREEELIALFRAISPGFDSEREQVRSLMSGVKTFDQGDAEKFLGELKKCRFEGSKVVLDSIGHVPKT